MQLFYSATLDQSVSQYVFPEEESRHIVKVLRKQEGDELQITNGKGFLFEAEILSADPKACKVAIVKTTKSTRKCIGCIWLLPQPRIWTDLNGS